jgi:hypothetical protein
MVNISSLKALRVVTESPSNRPTEHLEFAEVPQPCLGLDQTAATQESTLMKPRAPYQDEALLIETDPDRYSLWFRGVTYNSTLDVTALGVLLFGLRPSGLNILCIGDPSVAMHLTRHAAHILHLHATGERFTADGSRRISEANLAEWIESAADLAPTNSDADFVRDCVDSALGPDAYLSDEDYLLSKREKS